MAFIVVKVSCWRKILVLGRSDPFPTTILEDLQEISNTHQIILNRDIGKQSKIKQQV